MSERPFLDAPSFVERACPVCGRHGEAAGRHVDPEAARYRMAACAVPLRRCAACGMRFFDLVEGLNDAGQIYSELVLSAGIERPRHRALARVVLEAGVGPRMLELGSGACHVGRLLPDDHAITAVDRNPRSDGAPAHLQFVDADITALPDDLFAPASFDVVLLDNVLEHLPSFAPLLAQACRWLAPSGMVLVSVPNGRTLKRWLGGRHAREVHRPVEHVNIFDGAPLDRTFANLGLAHRRVRLRPGSIFETAVAASLLGWAPFGLYRAYARSGRT